MPHYLAEKVCFVEKYDEMERNLTSGSVPGNLIRFSLPYLVSYFLQTLYGMADLLIIGQFEGVSSTTAVSVGSQVMHMLTVMIVGLAMGTTVAVSHAVGAGDRRSAERSIGGTISIFTIVAVVMTALLIFAADGVVGIMSTPVEAVSGTRSYLLICFAGLPFIIAYNIISSIYRGLGDSRTPMFFVLIACVLNILLDILFMGPCSMGPSGAALGTVLSQAVSVVIALLHLKRSGASTLHVERSDLRLTKSVAGPILKVGFPIAAQDGLIQVAFIVITVIMNRRGLTDAAAVGIVEKVISFLFLVPSSILSSVSAIGAQNIGAGKAKRARETLYWALLIAVVFGFVVSLVVQFISEGVVSLFTSDEAVIHSGGQYLRGYVFDTIFAGIHFAFSGYFCAAGKAGISFAHNITAIVLMRIPGVYLMSSMYPDNLFPVGLATVSGSLLSALICIAAYLVITRRERRAQALSMTFR